MYLLDTVFLSEVRKRPQSRAMSWMRQQNVVDLFLSTITIMEIERGIEQQRRVDPPFAAALETWLRDNLMLFGDRILPITTAIAQRWGRMQIQLRRDDDDIAIAATALEHNLQVVTRNVRHFNKTGVVIINPFEAA
ncbi:MAG TPA: type II toxin-antitoxin system VapC family toxin [Rhizomicrobium sp.]